MQIKKIIVWTIGITSMFILGWGLKTNLDEVNLADNLIPTPATKTNMKFTSSVFADGGEIPTKYTCHGDNINPPFAISDVPAGTKTLALEMTDPDAPLEIFIHWLVWNINPDTKGIREKSVPDKAQQGTNSAGKIGYTGPCPPAKHRYFFKLFALDTSVGLDGKAKTADLDKAMAGHIIAQTTLTGIFGK